ncbi:MAG: DUF2442 domain-containing protein [Eubacteriales bacterium]
MFHKIKNIVSLPEYKLSVQFAEGVTKLYDVKMLFEKFPAFHIFKEHPEVFHDAEVDVGGFGVVWNDNLDISCEELWKNGV